jgi:hypothetical protein
VQGFSFDAAHPYTAGQHRGIDIGAAAGAPVLAPATGVVTFAGTVPASGKSVTIETPDGLALTLTHLGTIDVARDASVTEGGVVGTIGPSGEPEVEGPYVHFGVRTAALAQGYLDPLSFLPVAAPPAPPASPPAPALPEPLPVVPPSVEPAPAAPPAAEPPREVLVPPAEPAAPPAAVRAAAPVAAAKPAEPATVQVSPAPAPLPAAEPVLQSAPLGRAPTLHVELAADPVVESLVLLARGAAPAPRVAAAAGAFAPVAFAAAPVRGDAPMSATRRLRVHERGSSSRPRPRIESPLPGTTSVEALERRGSPPVVPLLAAALALLSAVGCIAARIIRSPAKRKGASPVAVEAEDPRRTRMAVRERAASHRPRRGVRGAGGRLRAVPPPQGQRRADGERDGRARDARDGVRGSRRRVAA